MVTDACDLADSLMLDTVNLVVTVLPHYLVQRVRCTYSLGSPSAVPGQYWLVRLKKASVSEVCHR
jgi:hypothetical protein